MFAQGYFCGIYCSSLPSCSHQVFYMQGRFQGRAPVYSIPWHSALVGVVESTIATCAENGLNSFNPGRAVHSSLPTFYGCCQCCLLSSNSTYRLLMTPPSLHACERQAGTNVSCLLSVPLSLVSSRRQYGVEHSKHSLHMSAFVPGYGLCFVGSQFHLLLHHRACCCYLFWQLSVVSTSLFRSAYRNKVNR